ncbi:hypothetical protein DPMN_122436 [Dreissena polymorpha]|uniref:Uncharacterized protein n=1 Tax=Dreissena polymorpha TaxID=45954 RepID=A0A9D4GPN9_DREPO|nr:hypothetical protein DPMN_122436 [Dreissena polymorpha]
MTLFGMAVVVSLGLVTFLIGKQGNVTVNNVKDNHSVWTGCGFLREKPGSISGNDSKILF